MDETEVGIRCFNRDCSEGRDSMCKALKFHRTLTRKPFPTDLYYWLKQQTAEQKRSREQDETITRR